ncbi:MAG: hypothetical protein Q9178_006228 [Gyalolechia marmorata]
MADFVFWNPSINANCTNLLADESYCVQAVGDINTYSGRAGYSTPPATQGPATGKYNDLPDATYDLPTTTPTSKPFAKGTRTDCNNKFDGGIFQANLTGTNWKSNCELAAASYNVELEDFGTWNTGLGDVNSTTCSFQNAIQYCGKLYYGSAPELPETGSLLPIRDGASPNCTEYIEVEEGYQYCIRAPGYTASTTSGSATAATSDVGIAPPTPTSPFQTGQPASCNKWYTIKSGDSCGSVEQAHFITHAQFRQWNPSVSEDCSIGFWLGKFTIPFPPPLQASSSKLQSH